MQTIISVGNVNTAKTGMAAGRADAGGSKSDATDFMQTLEQLLFHDRGGSAAGIGKRSEDHPKEKDNAGSALPDGTQFSQAALVSVLLNPQTTVLPAQDQQSVPISPEMQKLLFIQGTQAASNVPVSTPISADAQAGTEGQQTVSGTSTGGFTAVQGTQGLSQTASDTAAATSLAQETPAATVISDTAGNASTNPFAAMTGVRSGKQAGGQNGIPAKSAEAAQNPMAGPSSGENSGLSTQETPGKQKAFTDNIGIEAAVQAGTSAEQPQTIAKSDSGPVWQTGGSTVAQSGTETIGVEHTGKPQTFTPAFQSHAADATQAANSQAGLSGAANLHIKVQHSVQQTEGSTLQSSQANDAAGDPSAVQKQNNGASSTSAFSDSVLSSGSVFHAFRQVTNSAAGKAPGIVTNTEPMSKVVRAYTAETKNEGKKSDSGDDSGGKDAQQQSGGTPFSVPVQKPAAFSLNDMQTAKTDMGDIARQLSDALKAAPDAGTSTMRVHLSPQELGGINIRIVSQNGVLSVQISADSHHTGDLLASGLGELTRSLNDNGVNLQHVEVLTQQQNGFDASAGHSGAQQHENTGNGKAYTSAKPANEPAYDAQEEPRTDGKISIFA